MDSFRPVLAGLLLALPLVRGEEIPLKPARLAEPAWCGYADSFVALREGEVRLVGRGFPVTRDGKALSVAWKEKSLKPAAKAAFLDEGLAAVGLVLEAPPGIQDAEPLPEALLFLAGALEGKVAGQTLRFLDLDGNGSALDFGKDGVLYPGSRSLVPLERRMVVGRSAVEFSVQEGRLSAKVEPVRGNKPTEDEWKGMELWNGYRLALGVPALELDAALSAACSAHAQYLLRNPGSPSNEEDPALPGFTPQGRDAALNSCVNHEAAAFAPAYFLTMLYHETCLIQPVARRAGFAGLPGQCLMDGLRDESGQVPYRWPLPVPAPWQTLAWTACPGPERPSPVPEGSTTGVGPPVLLMFDPGEVPRTSEVRGALVRLNQGRREPQAVWLSSPDKPANPAQAANKNCIALIPRTALRPGSEYEADIRYLLDGKPCRARWRFFTAK